jgi:hypothetical protein
LFCGHKCHICLCTKLKIYVCRINVLYCGKRELSRQSRWLFNGSTSNCRGQLKCDGTCAETRFRLLVKWTSPFKSAGASVHSATGSRGVRISVSNGSNAGYTLFRGIVKSRGSLPFTSLPVCDRVPSCFSWSLQMNYQVN